MSIDVSVIMCVQVSLNLSNNRLSGVPEDLGALSSLRELFLQYNTLTHLPVGPPLL